MDSLELRNLADAIERLERARDFDAPLEYVTSRDCKIVWSYGAATTGYRELSQAMSKVVRRRFQELHDEAISDLENEVRLRKSALIGPALQAPD